MSRTEPQGALTVDGHKADAQLQARYSAYILVAQRIVGVVLLVEVPGPDPSPAKIKTTLGWNGNQNSNIWLLGESRTAKEEDLLGTICAHIT